MTRASFEVELTIDRDAVQRISGSDDVKAFLELIGQVGETAAKDHAPVDTGTLRRSITHELGSQGLAQYVRIGTNIFYAIFQELGTRFHPAHPFMRPALARIERFLKDGS